MIVDDMKKNILKIKLISSIILSFLKLRDLQFSMNSTSLMDKIGPIKNIRNIFYDILSFNVFSILFNSYQYYGKIKKGCEYAITVFADKERIRQVLINLVSNATKYGKYGGTIVASIYVTDDRHALIEISDDGIGIEEEHLTRIFERFYRTDNARSRDRGGSGLGLAICKHIIEAHAQSIHVRSTRDVGTTIGFTLDSKRD
jgi:two-component system phosphate regulon sensor histidine kinase PhoR